MELQEIISKIEALQSRADELLTKANEGDSSAADVKAMVQTVESEIMPEIATLKAERAAREREAELKALRAKVTTLDEVVEEMRKPLPNFAVGSAKAIETPGVADDNPYADGQHSFFADVKAANKGRQDAYERLMAVGGPEGKAMTEGVAAQGGYLVQKEIERAIVEAREDDNVLRELCQVVNVNAVEFQIDQLTLGTAAGWVAEMAEKPESTSLSLSSVSAGVFTAAGLATISNQLLADSNPAIDRLVTNDLSKRLAALEEIAFMSGSGTGQPLGILNTPGVQTQTNSVVDVTDTGGLLDSILDAISKVQSSWDEPTAILMHPRTWTRVLKAKDAVGTYLVGTPSIQQPRTAQKSIFGVPVVTSNRVPTNLGAGTNESRIIVGDFNTALVLDRQGITIDESPHVYFTKNATVFRAEMRVGFTAARQPEAFCVIGGTGLASG
jgi:HK97 family phage major capsid protein